MSKNVDPNHPNDRMSSAATGMPVFVSERPKLISLLIDIRTRMSFSSVSMRRFPPRFRVLRRHPRLRLPVVGFRNRMGRPQSEDPAVYRE